MTRLHRASSNTGRYGTAVEPIPHLVCEQAQRSGEDACTRFGERTEGAVSFARVGGPTWRWMLRISVRARGLLVDWETKVHAGAKEGELRACERGFGGFDGGYF